MNADRHCDIELTSVSWSHSGSELASKNAACQPAKVSTAGWSRAARPADVNPAQHQMASKVSDGEHQSAFDKACMETQASTLNRMQHMRVCVCSGTGGRNAPGE